VFATDVPYYLALIGDRHLPAGNRANATASSVISTEVRRCPSSWLEIGMDVALYGRALWTYKWLLLAGIIVAACAAVLAGYQLNGSTLTSRATETYSSSSTVLLSSAKSPMFQAETPSQTVPEGQTAPQPADLSSIASVYAYMVASDEIRSATEQKVGPLADDELLTSLQRTTQPPASDTTAGRLSLPIIAVVGTAATAERAEQISQAATQAFESFVSTQQDANGVPAEQRVQLTTLNQGTAVKADSSNPFIGVVLVGAGVLAIFIALIFVLYNARLRRADERTADGASRHEVIEPTDGKDDKASNKHRPRSAQQGSGPADDERELV
jgi:hypothetical protein